MRKPRVYVAGKLSDTATNYIKNIHKMIKEAQYLRKNGFAVYVPCIDILEGIVSGDMDYPDYFENSFEWLLSSDVVYVCPGYETSQGTAREIAAAVGAKIPVFYSRDSIKVWKNTMTSIVGG